MTKKPAQPKLYPTFRMTPKSKDLPATQGMLYLVRSELKSDIAEVRSDLKAEIAELRTELHTFKSSTEARFERVIQAIHKVGSEVARIGVLVEEQNAKNNLVLEGHTGLAQRQDRVESRVDEVEKTVRLIARSKS